MTIYLYLKKEIQNQSKFQSVAKGSKNESASFGNLFLTIDSKGRLYLYLAGDSFFPQELEEFVEEISLRECFNCPHARETGIYKYESAEAEVSVDRGYDIQIRGKKMEDVQKLLRLIKTGNIRPDESYEGDQQGKTRAELEKEITDLQLEVKALMAERKTLTEDLEKSKKLTEKEESKVRAICKIANNLREKIWPWCSKNTILEQIYKATD